MIGKEEEEEEEEVAKLRSTVHKSAFTYYLIRSKSQNVNILKSRTLALLSTERVIREK
jgi:hypothetical protein